MKVRFWGVRGSIAVPGPKTLRYGGNTTCIEVRTDDGTLIVLDAGTGVYQLAQSLLKELPVSAHVFISHTHWDHIQGLPFFIPIFIPGNTVRIHGAADLVTGRGIEQIMEVQLQYSYFPVREAELKARIEYANAIPGEPVQVGGATVTPVLLNHPVINLGYRVDADGKSLFFTGDYEPPLNIYAPGDEDFEEFEAIIAERRQAVGNAIRGVDMLIADAAYTEAEYPAKKGWGHGTYDSCLQLAREADAKALYCTHHEPTRGDDELEAVFAEALARHPGAVPTFLAREGMEVTL